MNKNLKYLEHFLNETIYLMPYSVMAVSFLSVILPKIGFNFDFVTWGNAGGFSLIVDVAFIKLFFFNFRYCWLTRNLPISMIFINILNILCNEYFPKHYELYGQIYEITIFSVTLLIFAVITIEKMLKK